MKRILLSAFLLISGLMMAQVPNYVPQSGLRSYWPFSGNTNDVSAAASHLTNNGAVLAPDRNGTPNSAYSFNGSNQSMIRTSPNWTFSSTTDFTMSVWILKTNTSGGVAMINATTAANNFIWLLQGGSNMSYGTNKQQSAWINLSTTIPLNSWTHYVCVYEAGVMTYIKNNVVQGTASFPYTNVTSANLPLYVGKGINGGHFSGVIDDIGVWDRALTTCEISDLYNSTATIVSVDAGSDLTVCAGQPVTLTGTGAANLAWDQSVTNGTAFTPLSSATYTLTGTDGAGCSGWDQVDVTVNQGLVDGGSDILLCDGLPVTLTATGATGISWDNGVQDGVPFTPTTSGTYTVSGTDTSGCFGADQVLVTLYEPTVNAGSNVTLCAGDSVVLNASGTSTYVWDSGAVNGSFYTPTNTGYYSVTGTDTANCTNTDSLYITVNPLANIQAGPDIDLCEGQSVTLNGTGGLFYIWNNNVFNGLPFTPNATNTYVVSGADSSNCFNSDTVVVTVNQPTTSSLTISAIDQYTLNGIVYSASGTYTQVINNSFGCDSTITLNLMLDFTGLDEKNTQNFSWYPNPTDQFLNVEIDDAFLNKQLDFYAVDGRLVKSVILSDVNKSVDVSDLKDGQYIGRIVGESAVVFRWMKN